MRPQIKIDVLDVALILVAMFLLLFVLCRTGVVQPNKKFAIAVIPTTIMALGLGITVYRTLGMQGVQGGFTSAWCQAGMFPMLVAMFLAMGFGNMLFIAHKDIVVDFLSGRYGYFGAMGAAFCTPGSFVAMPIVRELWEAGVGRPQLLVFLLGVMLMNLQLMFFFFDVLGPYLSIVRLGFGFAVTGGLAVICWIYQQITPILR